MNVRELIEALRLEDGRKMVVFDGYESGVDEALGVVQTRIKVDENWAVPCFGSHDESQAGETEAIKIISRRDK